MSLIPARTRPRLITPVFLLVVLSTFAYFVAIGITTPTLPRYVDGPLGGSNLAVGVAVGAFALTAVILRPWVGRFGDVRGRRALIIGGGIVVGVSIFGYALADSLTWIVVARLFTGIGEAAFYVGAASVINDIAPDDRRGEALSYFSLALFGGLAVGSVAGEVILDALDFTAVWASAGAASVFAGLVGLVVAETRPAGVERGGGQLINRGALLPGAILATNIWGLATFSSFVPLYALQLGMSGSRFVFALNSIVIIAIRLFGAKLPDQLGPKKSSRLALIGVAAGFVVIAAWAAPIGLFIGTIFYSVGHALLFPALMTVAINQAPAEERGSVVGTFTSFFDLSFGIGAASAGVIASFLGYTGAFAIAGAIAVGGLFLMNYLGEGRTELSGRAAAEAA